MKILYIGSGFVGACSAAVSADSGHDVLCYDLDERKIKMFNSFEADKIDQYLREEGLSEILIRNRERINFTSDYTVVNKFLDEVEVIFMCLPTPGKKDATGEADLSFYNAAAEKLFEHLSKRQKGKQKNYVVIVNKSTVPIKMVDDTEKLVKKFGVKNSGVVSNPEFLVEGRAIEDSIRPYRVVVGAKKSKDFEIMRQLYARFYASTTTKYIEVNPLEAAASKLLSNFFLFHRLGATFDVAGRLCELFAGVKYENVRSVITSDPRLGQWGYYDSVYSGGSCFIKDAASLAHQLEEAGVEANLVRATLQANSYQRDRFYSRAASEAKFSWRGKKVAVLGLAFKQDTNDVRNSPAVEIVHYLLSDGAAQINVFDPAALPMFKSIFDIEQDKQYKKIGYFNSEKDALKDTAALIILTDWPQFKNLSELIKKVCPRPYLIMDGRRMLSGQFDELQKKGYDIIAVGSSFLKGKIDIKARKARKAKKA